MDVYGSGPDRDEIEARARAKGCDLTFFPATDHSELGNYSVFINPSVSGGRADFDFGQTYMHAWGVNYL